MNFLIQAWNSFSHFALHLCTAALVYFIWFYEFYVFYVFQLYLSYFYFYYIVGLFSILCYIGYGILSLLYVHSMSVSACNFFIVNHFELHFLYEILLLILSLLSLLLLLLWILLLSVLSLYHPVQCMFGKRFFFFNFTRYKHSLGIQYESD